MLLPDECRGVRLRQVNRWLLLRPNPPTEHIRGDDEASYRQCIVRLRSWTLLLARIDAWSGGTWDELLALIAAVNVGMPEERLVAAADTLGPGHLGVLIVRQDGKLVVDRMAVERARRYLLEGSGRSLDPIGDAAGQASWRLALDQQAS